jgi:hypothetical protein
MMFSTVEILGADAEIAVGDQTPPIAAVWPFRSRSGLPPEIVGTWVRVSGCADQ